MVFSPKGFKDILPIYINRKMDIDIRERLEEEMTKCNSLRLYKNRVKKINNIFPDEVVENILSFTSCGCKKCVKTRKIVENISPYEQEIYDRWKGVDIEEIYCSDEYDKYLQDGLKLWACCFEDLNTFPTKKIFFRRFQNASDCDYYICRDLMIFPYEIPWADHREMSRFKKPICREFIIWMFCQRGCKFYPQLFDGEFQREVIRYIFG